MKKVCCLICLFILTSGLVSPVRAMIINITYDSSVTNLGFSTVAPPAVNSAVQWFQTQYTNPITLNITVAFSSSVGLGQSSFSLIGKTYAQITNALASRRVSPEDFSSVASLPPNDPTGGSQWYVSRANGKALGLVSANDSVHDGTVTFASAVSYTFDPNNRAVSGKYDFIGVFEHELSEVMGRAFVLNYGINGYGTFDLFRFTANGTRSFSTNASNVYFSVDNGATPQKFFYSNVNLGDVQDWVTSTPADAYDAFVSSGRQLVISSADILTLDVLGYNIPATGPVPTVPLLAGTRLGDGSFRISFTNTPGASFTVIASTNVNTILSSWIVLGAPTENSSGAFQFTDSQAVTNSKRFYRVRSP